MSSFSIPKTDERSALKKIRNHVAVGLSTPFYHYDLDLLNQTLQTAHDAAAKYGFVVHYAMKANSNPLLLKQIRRFSVEPTV